MEKSEKLSPKQSLYVFIDASNLWEAQKAKGRLFDYAKLVQFLKNQFSATSVKIFYYTAYPANGTRPYNLDNRHKFYTFLKKSLGFVVRKKPLKQITIPTEFGDTIIEKGNMDVEMTIDVLHNIQSYDTAIFFSGDSDFLALVSYLRQRNKSVFIFSSKGNISHELKTGGDGYFDVLQIQEDIWGKILKQRTKNV